MKNNKPYIPNPYALSWGFVSTNLTGNMDAYKLQITPKTQQRLWQYSL